MQTGPSGELETISKVTAAMAVAWEQQDKDALKALVALLRDRPNNSRLANTIGASLEKFYSDHGMI